jgi:RNA polymerase sigma-70 factor (ECF subfamily)
VTESAALRRDDSEPDDRALVIRCRSGDRSAFGVLVRRYQRRVFGLGLRMLGSADDADDLVQETFLRAWRALDRFEEDRPLAPWLLRIATNQALNVLAARGRRPVEELNESMPADGPGPDRLAEQRGLHERIRRAMAELPDEQRAILALRAGEGLSYREIADTLDIPVGTVMSRLARARETMRKKVPR